MSPKTNGQLARFQALFLITSFALPAAFTAFLVAARWPQWWAWTVPELTPLGWMQSVLLYTCALLAFGTAGLCGLADDGRRRALWIVLGAAFFYFTFDERFALHERLRDGFLAPRNFHIPGFFWVAPGDYVMLFLMAGGLLLLSRFLTLFRDSPASRRFFLAAVVVSAAAVSADSVDWKGWPLPVQRLEQFWEGTLETLAMVLYMNAFFRECLRALARLMPAPR